MLKRCYGQKRLVDAVDGKDDDVEATLEAEKKGNW